MYVHIYEIMRLFSPGLLSNVGQAIACAIQNCYLVIMDVGAKDMWMMIRLAV